MLYLRKKVKSWRSKIPLKVAGIEKMAGYFYSFFGVGLGSERLNSLISKAKHGQETARPGGGGRKKI
jgi:hypothetical protein